MEQFFLRLFFCMCFVLDFVFVSFNIVIVVVIIIEMVVLVLCHRGIHHGQLVFHGHGSISLWPVDFLVVTLQCAPCSRSLCFQRKTMRTIHYWNSNWSVRGRRWANRDVCLNPAQTNAIVDVQGKNARLYEKFLFFKTKKREKVKLCTYFYHNLNCLNKMSGCWVV